MSENEDIDKPKIDFTKYDVYYNGAVIEGLCSDGTIIYSKQCKGHQHFFELLNELSDQSDICDIRIELANSHSHKLDKGNSNE